MRILMGLVFYPRGGSAQVVRYLSRALRDQGHETQLLVGSLRDGDPEHDARLFFGDLPLTDVDYTEAWKGYRSGRDPISPDWDVPFHPSYEDKPDVPDRVFWRVDEPSLERLVRCWRDALGRIAAFCPDVLHLHHLNHLHLAAARGQAPILAHLHGTELKMLEKLPEARRTEAPVLVDLWERRLLTAATRVDHFFAISPDVRERGQRLLDVEEERISTIPNGVDTDLFSPRPWSPTDKLAFLQRILVEEPQGWTEGGAPGSLACSPDDLSAFQDRSGALKPLVLFVGRFLGFKRVPLLMEAVRLVNQRFEERGGPPPFNLLVWGGMPGEWEGEHPHTAAQRLGLRNVFFCGWLPHAMLAQGVNLADLFVAPSYYEPFGQVFLEAMATGIPCIATRSGGPLSFVRGDGPDANGWLAALDDVESLASALYTALTDPAERRRRGRNALTLVRREYSWSAVAARFTAEYHRAVERKHRGPASPSR
jgi:glycosyltransferase involved in cell wall biosynthesis